MKKSLYIMIAVILVASIIVTATIGLRVTLRYSEGVVIRFASEKDINVSDIESIASEIWGDDYIVKQVEFFDNSVQLKVRETTEEQYAQFIEKVNEKLETELTASDFVEEHVSNERLRDLIKPYIIPLGISTLLVVAYLAIRFRGARQMLEYLMCLIIGEGLYYSLYALCRIPVGTYTVPIGMALYCLITVLFPVFSELKADKTESEF